MLPLQALGRGTRPRRGRGSWVSEGMWAEGGKAAFQVRMDTHSWGADHRGTCCPQGVWGRWALASKLFGPSASL